jgi:hypothetical protein
MCNNFILPFIQMYLPISSQLVQFLPPSEVFCLAKSQLEDFPAMQAFMEPD